MEETPNAEQTQKSLQWKSLLEDWKTETKTGRFINKCAKMRLLLVIFGAILLIAGAMQVVKSQVVKSENNSYGWLWMSIFFMYSVRVWCRAKTNFSVKSLSDWLLLKEINPLNVLKENKEIVKCLNNTGDKNLLTPTEKQDAVIFINATINAAEKEKEKTKFILSVVAIISTAIAGILLACVFVKWTSAALIFLKGNAGDIKGALKLFVKIKLFYVWLVFFVAEAVLTKIDPVASYSKAKTEAWMKERLKDEY